MPNQLALPNRGWSQQMKYLLNQKLQHQYEVPPICHCGVLSSQKLDYNLSWDHQVNPAHRRAYNSDKYNTIHISNNLSCININSQIKINHIRLPPQPHPPSTCLPPHRHPPSHRRHHHPSVVKDYPFHWAHNRHPCNPHRHHRRL